MPNPKKIPPCDLTRQYSAISQPNPMNMPNISPYDLPMPNPHTTSHPVIGQCQTPKKNPPGDSPSSKLQWKISQIATFQNPKEKLTWWLALSSSSKASNAAARLLSAFTCNESGALDDHAVILVMSNKKKSKFDFGMNWKTEPNLILGWVRKNTFFYLTFFLLDKLKVTVARPMWLSANQVGEIESSSDSEIGNCCQAQCTAA